MVKGILGRKVGMTQLYDANGKATPVTVIQAGPCHVLQLRTKDRDGYEAVQVGFLDKPRRKANRAERGHVANVSSKRSKIRAAGGELPPKADCEPKRHIRELRGPVEGVQIGQQIKVDIFRPALEELPGLLRQLAEKSNIKMENAGWMNELIKKKLGDYRKTIGSIVAVDVTGLSKGRGYSGVMRRHNFKGQRATHGVKKVHRHGGGTGALAANRGGGRPKKGKKMAGRLGCDRITMRNLKVYRVDEENNLLLIRGAVPGPNGGLVMVRCTNMV